MFLGLVGVVVGLLVALFAFPKHRIHIIVGTIAVGAFLYFTTDQTIREEGIRVNEVRPSQVSIHDMTLYFSGAESVFSGRIRNSSRYPMAGFDLRLVLTFCVPAEADIADISEETKLLKTVDMGSGVFMDVRRSTPSRILDHARTQMQRRRPGNIPLDCSILTDETVTIMLQDVLPPGRERRSEFPVPLELEALLPGGFAGWYWGITEAYTGEETETPPTRLQSAKDNDADEEDTADSATYPAAENDASDMDEYP
ncbi:MAG: hypothetical protein EA357_00325 [Micavibrio sp.]|nr:MAG: hypothetical protein EA357_00325 [Micavibrio sp.]